MLINLSDEDIKLMAKGLVLFCFRNNTCLEDYHAEGVPIDDARMKQLMIDCVNNVYVTLNNLFSENTVIVSNMIKALIWQAPKEWNEPEEPEWAKRIRELLAEREE